MSVHQWGELDRVTLGEVLPRSTVLLSTGAVEQHGPHLPTGTDSLLSQVVCRAAAERAAGAGLDVVLAPPVWFGASDHHLPFGGTLSLRASTLLAVLTDLLGSLAGAGATRVLLVNGHGGNSGICHAAASAASAHHDVQVAHVDYWDLLGERPVGLAVPGHAGAFESALMLSSRPDLVGSAPDRPEPVADPPSRITVHSSRAWRAIDGWTDHPDRASAELGRQITEDIVQVLSQELLQWGRRP